MISCHEERVFVTVMLKGLKNGSLSYGRMVLEEVEDLSQIGEGALLPPNPTVVFVWRCPWVECSLIARRVAGSVALHTKY